MELFGWPAKNAGSTTPSAIVNITRETAVMTASTRRGRGRIAATAHANAATTSAPATAARVKPPGFQPDGARVNTAERTTRIDAVSIRTAAPRPFATRPQSAVVRYRAITREAGG